MGEEEVEFTPLTHDLLCESLSEIHLFVEEEGSGYAFTKLVCQEKELTNLGNLGKIDGYTHLKHVVFSSNKLSDIAPLTKMPHLLTLAVDNNQVENLGCLEEAELPWCQRINLSSNKLKALPSLGALQRLRFAYFGSNEIESLEGFGSHPVLEELDLQENKLTSLKGLGQLESLRRLVLTGNQLTSLEGLDTPSLAHLDVAKNQLAALEFIDGAPECKVLDISGNQLVGEDPELPEIRRLGTETRKLQDLRIAGNPVADGWGESCKIEILVRAPQLLRVDEEELTAEDREAAKVREQELIEEARQREAERLAAEQAEAEAAAAAAAEENAEEGG